jgi:GTP-binding protein
MRASGKDENTICTPVKPMTLERAINFINDDEMVEVTPLSIRLHKRELSAVRRHQVRSRQNKAKKLTG